MRWKHLLLVLACCLVIAGCDSAKVNELTKQVAQLQEELKTVQQERDKLREQVAQSEAIRKGYEDARQKFQQQLSGLSAVLGAGAANVLPPFEELKNSDWVGKLMPSAAQDLGKLKELKEVESELLKGILGGQAN